VLLSGLRRQAAESRTSRWRNSLGNGMIMIATNGRSRPLANPLDARDRISAVFHEIAKYKAGVKPFLNCAQGRPIGVDVCQNKDSHTFKIPLRFRRQSDVCP